MGRRREQIHRAAPRILSGEERNGVGRRPELMATGGGAGGDRSREMRRRSGGGRGPDEDGDAEEERRRTSFSTPRCTDKEGRRKKKNLTYGPML